MAYRKCPVTGRDGTIFLTKVCSVHVEKSMVVTIIQGNCCSILAFKNASQTTVLWSRHTECSTSACTNNSVLDGILLNNRSMTHLAVVLRTSEVVSQDWADSSVSVISRSINGLF